MTPPAEGIRDSTPEIRLNFFHAKSCILVRFGSENALVDDCSVFTLIFIDVKKNVENLLSVQANSEI